MMETPEPLVYQIRLEGHIDPAWSEWLGGMEVTPLECGETLLSGPITHQTALHGVLARIRDLNLDLISLNRI